MSSHWDGKNLRLAINTWLTFESLCNRSNLFSESYLTKPLGEYLSANCNMDIIAEHNHPLLIDAGVGRPPQIDFVVKRKNSSKFDAAIELKWYKKGSNKNVAIRRIFADLLRLRLLLEDSKFSDSKTFFLVSMEKSSVKEFKAMSIGRDEKSFYKHVLSGEKSRLININDDYFSNISIDEKLKIALQRKQINQFGIKQVYFASTEACSTGLWKVTKLPTGRPRNVIQTA